MYLLWVLLFIPNLLIYLACMILNPVVALFVTKRDGREYLIKPLYWFQTHDNPVDEYWYGGYFKDSLFSYVKNATQEQYDNSRFLRYVCRLLWLWRNCAYGFSYNLFGRDLIGEEKVTEVGNEKAGYWRRFHSRGNSWQLKAHYPIGLGLQIDVNVGWKTHKGFPRAMYADRLFSLRFANPT